MIRHLSLLIRDESGASIIEMGLAAPILATLLVGMIDLSNAYSEKLQVVQVAQRTIEKVQVQSFDEAKDKDALQAEAAEAAGVSTSAVAVEAWRECSGTKKSFTDDCLDTEMSARYVSVEITKSFEPFFPMKMFGGNADGTYTVRGKAGIQVQ